MPIDNAERASLVAEVRDRFRGVWPAITELYTEAYGEQANWPEKSSLRAAYGYEVNFFARARRLVIQGSDSDMQVGIIFSRKGQNATGLSVTVPGRVDYVGTGGISETISEEGGHPSKTHLWHESGKLTAVKVYLDEVVGFEYYEHATPPWGRQRARAKLAEQQLPSELIRHFPENLTGETILWGAEIPWQIDAKQRAEEIIAKSGLRRFRYSISG